MASIQRRVALRQFSNWQGRCQLLSDRSEHMWWIAQVRDVATLGVGLLLRQRLEPGTRLLVELTSPDGRLIERFHAAVVHVTPDPDGWLVGCAFETIGEGDHRTGEP
jgi:hypothetical protein